MSFKPNFYYPLLRIGVGDEINWKKSCLVGINSSPQAYKDIANDLNCQIWKFPLLTLARLYEDPHVQKTFGSPFRKM